MAWQEGICNERSGFLFEHACDRVPAVSCGGCGRPVCEAHLRITDDGDRCISCQKRDPEAKQLRRQSDDDDDYYYYHYDPYFYGHHYETDEADYWGEESYATATAGDANDFTAGDAQALQSEGDDGFETDMGGS